MPLRAVIADADIQRVIDADAIAAMPLRFYIVFADICERFSLRRVRYATFFATTSYYCYGALSIRHDDATAATVTYIQVLPLPTRCHITPLFDTLLRATLL